MTFEDFFVPPQIRRGFLSVWRRNFLYYRKTWIVSLFWTVLEPLVYLGAIGYGLGGYVNNIEGHSYIEYFFPGILCSTTMMTAFFEGTYGCYTKYTHQKTYATILLTRVSPEEIIFGEVLWTACKGFFGALGVTAIAAGMGLVDTWRILPALGVLFFVSWLFASLAMIVVSIIWSYDSIVYFTSGFIVPMSMISGVYFPLEQLPPALKGATYLLPLTHATEAVRKILHGEEWGWAGLHVLVIVVAGLIAFNFAARRMSGKLLK